MNVECSICMGNLMEPPPNGSGPSPSKKAKASNANSNCLPCGHVFHRECILGWYTSQHTNQTGGRTKYGTCPVCRNRANQSSLYPVYLSTSSSSSANKIATETESPPASSCLPVLSSKGRPSKAPARQQKGTRKETHNDIENDVEEDDNEPDEDMDSDSEEDFESENEDSHDESTSESDDDN